MIFFIISSFGNFEKNNNFVDQNNPKVSLTGWTRAQVSLFMNPSIEDSRMGTGVLVGLDGPTSRRRDPGTCTEVPSPTSMD